MRDIRPARLVVPRAGGWLSSCTMRAVQTGRFPTRKSCPYRVHWPARVFSMPQKKIINGLCFGLLIMAAERLFAMSKANQAVPQVVAAAATAPKEPL